jgi:uncharacterized protein (DUF305 family)
MPLNSADKKFLKEMVPHHKIAVDMAKAVIKDGSDIRVYELARSIRDGQTKEIEKMTAWLADVGEKPNKTMKDM